MVIGSNNTTKKPSLDNIRYFIEAIGKASFLDCSISIEMEEVSKGKFKSNAHLVIRSDVAYNKLIGRLINARVNAEGLIDTKFEMGGSLKTKLILYLLKYSKSGLSLNYKSGDYNEEIKLNKTLEIMNRDKDIFNTCNFGLCKALKELQELIVPCIKRYKYDNSYYIPKEHLEFVSSNIEISKATVYCNKLGLIDKVELDVESSGGLISNSYSMYFLRELNSEFKNDDYTIKDSLKGIHTVLVCEGIETREIITNFKKLLTRLNVLGYNTQKIEYNIVEDNRSIVVSKEHLLDYLDANRELLREIDRRE